MTRGRRLVQALPYVAACFLIGCACGDWPAYRHDGGRTADQPRASALSDPTRVSGLHEIWTFRPSNYGDADADGFVASPAVHKGKVFIGHRNGRFYAVDANTGKLIWRYPVPPQPALIQAYGGNGSSPGIASSATIGKAWVRWFWFLKWPVRVVIFGAPDPAVCAGTPPACGSGRLWALNANTGQLVWKSDVIANLTGTNWGSTAELHERIGYSSPVVANGNVYVGIADNGDSPIQRGRLVAVSLNTGTIVGTFNFMSSGPPRGGGIWSSPAAIGNHVFVTTGNGCRPGNGGCTTEPPSNHALSMLELDGASGAIQWALQPVPWILDADPDWAGTPLVAKTSCGTLAVGTQKDGYTHAVNVGSGAVAWSFPYVTGGLPFTYGYHGDWGWTRPAAVWKDVIIAITGGFPITTSLHRFDGYGRIYALNACAPYNLTDAGRVRWIADVPELHYTGQPTVSQGMVYVGNREGKLFIIADPDRSPTTARRCANPLDAYTTQAACEGAGYEWLPSPKVWSVQLWDAPGVPTGWIRTEPVLARGRVYAASTSGVLHALTP
jgi:outer membrane protein assembly factor BamB